MNDIPKDIANDIPKGQGPSSKDLLSVLTHFYYWAINENTVCSHNVILPT